MITILYTVIGGLILLGITRLINKPRVSFTLEDEKSVVLKPQYVKQDEVLYYVVPGYNTSQWHKLEISNKLLDRKLKEYNKFGLQFVLNNSGRESLEHYKLKVSFEGVRRIESSEILGVFHAKSFEFCGKGDRTLLQDDPIILNVDIMPKVGVDAVWCKWEIKGNKYTKKGKIKIRVEPNEVISLPEVRPVFSKREIPEGAKTVDDLEPIGIETERYCDLLDENMSNRIIKI